MRVTNDRDLWYKVLAHAYVIYSVEKDNLRAPKNKSSFVKNELPKLLQNFASNNVELICEVPSVKALSTNDPELSAVASEPYNLPFGNDDGEKLSIVGYEIDEFLSLIRRIGFFKAGI